MDAGGQLIQETNISVMLPHHVASQRGKLDDMTFPAVQIEDALPLVLHQAMADLVWGYMITEPIKISSYGEPGGTGPHMTDVKRKKLARYEFVIENLPFAFEEMLISGTDSFCKLAALDVGKDRKKRKAISKAMAKHGEAKINRTDPVRALAGFSGYIRALSEAVMDLQIKFAFVVEPSEKIPSAQRLFLDVFFWPSFPLPSCAVEFSFRKEINYCFLFDIPIINPYPRTVVHIRSACACFAV